MNELGLRGVGWRLSTVCGLAVSLALATTAVAQTLRTTPETTLDTTLPITLLADDVIFDQVSERVVARGNVQIFHGERTLTADEIVYDRATDTISASGRITLRNPDGSTLFADYAELDPQLQDGLLRSARAVLAQRFKLAAAEARRVDGRFNVLEKAVFSNCVVCTEQPVPLWQIRARRVVHDQLEKQIHYEDAIFDVAGTPVLYLPYFRHPDPSAERVSGFLLPDFFNSNVFGYGIRLPYYLVIDDQSDLTVTPFVMSEETPILDAEYRRVWNEGALTLAGSAKHDTNPNLPRLRGHVDSYGHHYLTDSVFAHFDANLTTDDGYLRSFELSDDDRLESTFGLSSFRENGYWSIGGVYFQSLRDNEPTSATPVALPEFELRQIWEDAIWGGSLGVTASGVYLSRDQGQREARFSLGADWEREWISRQGIIIRAHGAMMLDLFRVWDSTTVPNELNARITPEIGIDLRYPFIRATENATHIVEPIVQLIWSETSIGQTQLPNEDSLLVEFDETNLFDTSRFSGYDRIETGFRGNLGVRYERIDDDGWSLGFVLGRVLRASPQGVFSGVSGLSGTNSDYVGAVSLDFPPYLKVINRVLFTDGLQFDRNELRFDINYTDLSVAGSYLYLSRDILGGALSSRSEAALSAGYLLSSNWEISGDLRYDFVSDKFVRAGGKLTYGNECVEVDFSISRRFTSSTTVDASTTFGLTLRLAGLGSELARARENGQCRLNWR